MPLITSLTFVDVWPVSHILYARRGKLSETDGLHRLRIVDSGKRVAEKDWTGLSLLIKRCDKVLAKAAPNLEIEHADLEMLKGGAYLPWAPGDDSSVRVYIGLATHPLSRIYVTPPDGSYSLGWGEAVLLNPGSGARWSWVNLAEQPVAHLCLTLRRSEDLSQTHEPEADLAAAEA